MFEIAITLLLLFICALICILFFAIGVLTGIKMSICHKSKERPTDSKKTDDQKKKIKRELDNFYNYTGDRQE